MTLPWPENLTPDEQRALDIARDVFTAIDQRDMVVANALHPEVVGKVDFEAIFDDFAALADAGFAPLPKSVPGMEDAIAFNLLEGVTEVERLEDEWRAPRAIVMRFSKADQDWRFYEYRVFDWEQGS